MLTLPAAFKPLLWIPAQNKSRMQIPKCCTTRTPRCSLCTGTETTRPNSTALMDTRRKPKSTPGEHQKPSPAGSGDVRWGPTSPGSDCCAKIKRDQMDTSLWAFPKQEPHWWGRAELHCYPCLGSPQQTSVQTVRPKDLLLNDFPPGMSGGFN